MRNFEDHEIRSVINTLRDTAVSYGQTQQLRNRIADIVIPLLKQGTVPTVANVPFKREKPKAPEIRFSDFAEVRNNLGTFVGINGWPKGWLRTVDIPGAHSMVMILPIDGSVIINGKIDDVLSQQRKAVMAAARGRM